MLARGLLLIVLALASLTVTPALAQNAPSWRTVYVCRYTDLKTPNGESAAAETRPFAVPESVTGEQITNDWIAWYGAQNPQLAISSYSARCSGSVEAGLKYLQELIRQYARWTIVRSDWIPPYAVPYGLPKEIYYYCVAPEQGLQRRLITDLFKAPMPDRIDAYMEKVNQDHAVWLRSIGYNYYTTNMGCSPTSPEAFWHYVSMLDGMARITDPSRPFAMSRSAWPGVDPKAAPNLIDDLAARAEYAKKRIMGAAPSAKTAPPPAPKPKPTAAPASAAVKTDTSLRDAGKAWDEQVRKTLAEEAKKKVELAAKQAQANAKAKADLEAFLKARRKQGSAQ